MVFNPDTREGLDTNAKRFLFGSGAVVAASAGLWGYSRYLVEYPTDMNDMTLSLELDKVAAGGLIVSVLFVIAAYFVQRSAVNKAKDS